MTTPPFEPVPSELDFPKYEREILSLWKERRILEQALRRWTESDAGGAKRFVFYEGPPTANGLPHNGHVLTRVMKDLFPRYRAMRGDRVLRKGGWDTHGLPVEVEVEKELRIHGKAAIEQFGVKPFVSRCIESVFRYTSEWERQTERIGFWVSLDDAYVTYHKSYVQSVWWALSELFKKGLLYQGHKVVWWWAQGGTALSSGEVGLGYKTVDDPSVYVAFPLVEEPDTALVVWTTTPWTLPSNGYAAVKPGCSYDVFTLGEPLPKAKPVPVDLSVKKFLCASELRPLLEKKLGRHLPVVRSLKAEELVGKRYLPPFDVYSKDLSESRAALKTGGDQPLWWRVIAEDFVTLDSGTGIVHIAPAFGEDDHQAHLRQLSLYAEPEQVKLFSAVQPDGAFKAEMGRYAGRWVKDCDRDLIRELSERRLLLFEELYRHDYPFCWRADSDPLIQMARPAWFIKTTARLEQALSNNESVNWLPDHIKAGRFGDFLRNNVDWALSRERYWGTPLNVWICEANPEHRHAPASIQEIEELNPDAFASFHEAKRQDPNLNDHLQVHKPWIDEVAFPCPECGNSMRRVPEVIDCWFDSGCMPFAQWGFPHAPGSKARFDAAFPADFISEAIDQTRGWFYSLLMASTLLFDAKTQKRLGLDRPRSFPHPYKTCIVLGHVCDREGKKESKSKGNYTPPEIIMDRVAMQFAVLEEAHGVVAQPGRLLIAREDLEGMDLGEGVEVVAYRPDRTDTKASFRISTQKKLPRRVVLVSAGDRERLGLKPAAAGLETPPVEVPRLPAEQRLTIEDPNTPAPGADAFRWFFYASSPPWSNVRHSLHNVRTQQKDFIVKLRNVYSFFTIYANIDGWSPTSEAHRGRPVHERALLDRWLISELNLAIDKVAAALDQYLAYDAALSLIDLVEALSNWYVRRSRARFWVSELPIEKCDAYQTLYDTLVTLSQLIAPFVPFFSEEMYQNLVVRAGVKGAIKSVHLSDFPQANANLVDRNLAEETRAVRDIVSLGLSVRTANKLKVRQPLQRADVVLNDGDLLPRLRPYEELIKEELNVHELVFMFPGHDQGAVSFKLKPDFRSLGPRLGKGVQQVKRVLDSRDNDALHADLLRQGQLTIELDGQPLELTADELSVIVEAKPGYAAETARVGVVVLHTTLTEELIDEGILREIVSRVQAQRKDERLEFTDRIALRLDGSERILRVAREGRKHIERECLAQALRFEAAEGARQYQLGDEQLSVDLQRVGP